MGMFDYISCEPRLPGYRFGSDYAQTKSLDCTMASYIITGDGRLTTRRGFSVEFSGDIEFTTIYMHGNEERKRLFVASFRRGRLMALRAGHDRAEYSAYETGAAAFRAGLEFDENPYGYDEPDHESWNEGWLSEKDGT